MDQKEYDRGNVGSNDYSAANECKSSKNPGLKIISKQVMRAVQQNGYTTYKDVANVVSQVSNYIFSSF